MAWMIFPRQKSDFTPVENEDNIRAILKGSKTDNNVVPYWLVSRDDQAAQASLTQQYKDGPVVFIMIIANGMPKLGAELT